MGGGRLVCSSWPLTALGTATVAGQPWNGQDMTVAAASSAALARVGRATPTAVAMPQPSARLRRLRLGRCEESASSRRAR